MKWIIVFYQVFVTIPDGEIFFSGLENGKNFINLINSLIAIIVQKVIVKKH